MKGDSSKMEGKWTKEFGEIIPISCVKLYDYVSK